MLHSPLLFERMMTHKDVMIIDLYFWWDAKCFKFLGGKKSLTKCDDSQ